MRDMKSIVTWNGPENGDAHREAKRLVACYPLQAVFRRPSALQGMTGINCIIVTHRSDLPAAVPAIAATVRDIASWTVLAGCSSAAEEYGQTLADDNEMLSPAQRLAQLLGEGAHVDGTTRPLTFAEVGEGLAFAPALQASVLVPTEYPNPIDSAAKPLWKRIGHLQGIDLVTHMLARV